MKMNRINKAKKMGEHNRLRAKRVVRMLAILRNRIKIQVKKIIRKRL